MRIERRVIRFENGQLPYLYEQEARIGEYLVGVRERKSPMGNTSPAEDEWSPWSEWYDMGIGVFDWIATLR